MRQESIIAAGIGMPGGAEWLVIFVVGMMLLAGAAIAAFLCCRIFAKTGYPWALGLIILIPGGRLVILCILAFMD